MSSSSDEEYQTIQKSGTRKRQIKAQKKTKKNKSRKQSSSTRKTTVRSSNGKAGNVNEGASTSNADGQSEHQHSEASSSSATTHDTTKANTDATQDPEEASPSNDQEEGSAVAIPSPHPDTTNPTPSNEDQGTAPPTPSQNQDVEQAGPSNQGGSARERFNQRNQSVTPLRKCSELIPGRRYKVLNLARTNTQFGSAVRAFIVDDRSPTGKSFCYLPVRFRNLSDEDLAELNVQSATNDGLHILYSGRVGKADMIELV